MGQSQIKWLFHEGVNTIRFEGLHILSWRMLRWALSSIGDLRAITFCRKDITQPLVANRARADIVIRQATEGDIDPLAALTEKRWTKKQRQKLFKEKTIKETIFEEFTAGNICYIALAGTEMAHYNWIYFNKKEFVHYFIQLNDHEALCDNAFTSQEWRGMGIHAAVHNQMLLFLQQSGFHTAYTHLLTDNISSKKALQHLGWDFYGKLVYFSLFGSDKVWMWQIHAPLDPFIPVK